MANAGERSCKLRTEFTLDWVLKLTDALDSRLGGGKAEAQVEQFEGMDAGEKAEKRVN